MTDGADPQPLLREAAARLRVSRFEIVEPSLHDIFVERVTRHGIAEQRSPPPAWGGIGWGVDK
jgi:flavin reductase (DIM6/NTAB) family NADH-FMN oxidoreductase RutF